VDRALYLPWEWSRDIDRRVEAGVPEAVGFATKVELAKRMLRRAFAADVPARWWLTRSTVGRTLFVIGLRSAGDLTQ
jgi:SRSO17 transposase